jgi:hypothetical protein
MKLYDVIWNLKCVKARTFGGHTSCVIFCTNALQIRNIGSYCYKIKFKLMNRINEFQLDGE